MNPSGSLVSPNIANFKFATIAFTINKLIESPRISVAILRVYQVPKEHPSQSFTVIAEHLLECRIRLENLPFQIAMHNSHCGRFEDCAEALVTVANHPPTLALAYIPDIDDHKVPASGSKPGTSRLCLERRSILAATKKLAKRIPVADASSVRPVQ